MVPLLARDALEQEVRKELVKLRRNSAFVTP